MKARKKAGKEREGGGEGRGWVWERERAEEERRGEAKQRCGFPEVEVEHVEG